MAADSDTDGPLVSESDYKFQPDNLYIAIMLSLFFMVSHFLGLCVPHTCLVELAPMSVAATGCICNACQPVSELCDQSLDREIHNLT